MKRYGAKFITSILLAAAMISASAVCAGAAEYYKPPVYIPGGNGTSASAPEGKPTGTSADAPANVLTDEAVKEIIKNGSGTAYISEDVNGNATVSEAAIGEIAKSDKPISINVDSAEGIDFSIEIDPRTIKEVKAVNLAMDISTPGSDKTLSGVDIPAGSVVIEPAQKGDFGMTLKITLPASALSGLDLSRAEAFYIADNGDVTRLDGAFRKNSDGSASVSISHASAYVVSDEDLTGDEEIANIDEKQEEKTDDRKEDVTPAPAKEEPTVTVVDGKNDTNPVTGTAIAFGSLTLIAGAAAIISRKRK